MFAQHVCGSTFLSNFADISEAEASIAVHRELTTDNVI